MSTIFTGFDSAWGGKAPGAICDLMLSQSPTDSSLQIVQDPVLVRWPEALNHFRAKYQTTRLHVIAIDQGLIVPNDSGMRPVERKLASALMSKYRCGAHASNRGNESCYGASAGIWQLVRQLETSGYRQSPKAVADGEASSGRYFFECYPHPAIIGIFNLERTLQYKVHKKQKEDWFTLVNHLRSLANAEFKIENIADFVTNGFEQTKANEDKLDAIIAAYTAAYLWKYGWKRSMCMGDAETGYFVSPVSERLREALSEKFPSHPEIDLRRSTTPPSALRPPVAAKNLKTVANSTSGNSRSDFTDAALLRITDTGCLWGRENPWMKKELCVDHRLEIEVIGIPEQPSICFVPFRNQAETQFGMRLDDDDSKLIWKHLAAGRSKSNAVELDVTFRYRPQSSQERKESGE